MNRTLTSFFVGFFFRELRLNFFPLFTSLKKCISSNHKDFLCLEGYLGDLLELKKCLDFLPITKSLIIGFPNRPIVRYGNFFIPRVEKHSKISPCKKHILPSEGPQARGR
jgi:hypothetical protein